MSFALTPPPRKGKKAWLAHGADFSDDGLYRYRLWRVWDPALPRIAWCMLNPSTADADVEDPTIRRCIAFSKAWGFGQLDIVNLFAWRSTNPKILPDIEDPVGPQNDKFIAASAEAGTARTMVAWGGSIAGSYVVRRALAVLEGPLATRTVWHLGKTGINQPRHPLYLPAALSPEETTAEALAWGML